MPDAYPSKTCATCKRELVLGYFPKATGTKDGHPIHCVTCHNEKKKKQPSYKKYNKTGGKRWQRMNLNNETNCPMPPAPKIKSALNKEEILEVVSRLEDVESLLSAVDVKVLLENDALDGEHAEAIVFARVRLIQCQKLLGARYTPVKHMVHSAGNERKYY